MIKPFEFFIKEGLVRKSSGNISMAKSFLEKAQIRVKRIDPKTIEENEASIVFEDIYESLREAAQALMEVKGYKPYSHEAVISFVKEHKYLSDEKTNIFDNYRILRNNLVYKAEKVSIQKCLEALEFTKQTLPEIDKQFNSMIS